MRQAGVWAFAFVFLFAPDTWAQDKQKPSEFTLKFENGQSRTFKSNLAACEKIPVDFAACVEYELVAENRAAHAYVVKVSYYEGAIYRLISTRTGNEVLLSTEPEYSPGVKRLVSVAADESGYNDLGYGIGIWSVTDPATPEWKYSVPPDQYEVWEFVGWDGDDRIKLRVQMWVGGEPKRELKQFDADLVLTSTGWQLNRPKN